MRSSKLQRLTLEVDTVKSHGLGRLINTPVKIKACWNTKLLLKISFIEMERNTSVLLVVHSTTSTTETSTTDSTRITNEMATSSDYLMKYFNGFLAVLLE